MVEHTRTMGGDNFCWVCDQNGSFTAGDTIALSDGSKYGARQSSIVPSQIFGVIRVDCDFQSSNVVFDAKDCVMSNVTYYERVTHQVIDKEEYEKATIFSKNSIFVDGNVYKRIIREESSTAQEGFEERTREECTYPGTTSNVVHDFQLKMIDKNFEVTEKAEECVYRAAYVPFV